MKKFGDEALREHVLKNPSAAPEERALSFSVKHQSVYARMKALGVTRKKNFYEERDEEKRREFCGIIKDEKEDDIVYIDESGIKNTLRNEYAWSPRGESVHDETKGRATEKLNIAAGLPKGEIIAPMTA